MIWQWDEHFYLIIADYHDKWEKKEPVVMRGISSCSKDELVALGFAGNDNDPNNRDVLFVINFGH